MSLSLKLAILISGYMVMVAGWNESYFIREVLMKNYDIVSRPVLDPSQPVSLSISIGIKSVIGLDMKKQTLFSFGWLKVNWYDQFLTWDTAKNPVKFVHLTTAMLWRPELVVINTVSDLEQLEEQKVKVIVRNDGKVTWYPGGLFETFCSIDISHYPLDTQTCSVDIMSWSSDKSLVNGTFSNPAFEIGNLDSHPEWTLVHTESVYNLWPTNYWVLKFKFTLQRRVMFYVINIIVPIVLLSLMNCLVFLLPVESGEKMTVCVTVFLSFAVFMSLINDSLPQNSDALCLFSAFVAVQMFLSVCSIVMASIVVFIFEKDGLVSKPSGEDQFSLRPLTQRKISCVSSDFKQLQPLSAMSSSQTLKTLSSSRVKDLSSSLKSVPLPSARELGDLARADESTDSDSNASPADGKTVSESLLKFYFALLWRLMSTSKNLTPHERHLLSRALDKVCFVLTIIVNIVSCVIFIALMVLT